MKSILPALFATGAMLVSFNSHAVCPEGLDAEALADCIVVEGSGANYEQWQRNYQQTAEAEASHSSRPEAATAQAMKVNLQGQ